MSQSNKKEKFTTTLNEGYKYKLAVLSAYNKFDYINQYLEDIIDKKWKCYENEMAKKQKHK